jgi:hypothetical protein
MATKKDEYAMEELLNEFQKHVLENMIGTNGKYYDDEDSAEEELEDSLISELFDYKQQDDPPFSKKKRNRFVKSGISFWETLWGQLISHPNVNDPNSYHGKLFRRRFRLPFPAFLTLLLKICRDYNIFDMKYETKPPLEAKVLACLRILGRDSCADDVNKVTAHVIGESTANYVFKQFIKNMTERVYHLLIKNPEGEDLKKIRSIRTIRITWMLWQHGLYTR